MDIPWDFFALGWVACSHGLLEIRLLSEMITWLGGFERNISIVVMMN